jgi:hypothetical protein
MCVLCMCYAGSSPEREILVFIGTCSVTCGVCVDVCVVHVLYAVLSMYCICTLTAGVRGQLQEYQYATLFVGREHIL